MPNRREITSLEITVRDDESTVPQLWRRVFVFDLHLVRHLARLWKSRYLLYALAMRGIRSRYKQSMLGIGWALLTPAAMTVVFSYVFTRMGVSEKVIYPAPLPLFLLFNLTFWNLFQRALTNGSTSLVTNMDLVTKVFFPREVLPISSVLTNLVDWALAFTMFLIFAFAVTFFSDMFRLIPGFAAHFPAGYRFVPHVRWLWVPVLLLLLLLFTMGVVFAAATMQVYFRDVSHFLSLVWMLWLVLTPVLYPLAALAGGRATTLIILNPLTGLFDGLRLAMLARQSPWENHVIYAAGCSVIVFVAGYCFLKHEERYFADVV